VTKWEVKINANSNMTLAYSALSTKLFEQ